MAEDRGRPDADACFVCGPGNEIGLKVTFRLDGDVCRAEFTPETRHQGYDGVTHGGILYSLLDDVMANCLFLKGIRAYTAKCEIRYRDPVPVGTPLRMEGREVRKKGRFVILEGRIFRAADDAPVAEAESTFLLVDGADGSPS
ncbi:PaaI family thioesterase [Nitrospinota bacterium]